MEHTILNNTRRYELKLNTHAAQTLRRGCDILDFFGITYWLGGGTALGVYRDHDFCKGDTDIDIEILGPCELSDCINQIFEESNFTLVRKVLNDETQLNQTAFWDNTYNNLFDIIYFNDNGKDEITYWSEINGELKYPKSFIQLISQISFMNSNYPIINPEIYLPWVYGKTWKTPLTHKETIWSFGKDK